MSEATLPTVPDLDLSKVLDKLEALLPSKQKGDHNLSNVATDLPSGSYLVLRMTTQVLRTLQPTSKPKAYLTSEFAKTLVKPSNSF